MLEGKARIWVFLQPENMKVDPDAIADAVRLGIDMNNHEVNFLSSVFLGMQGGVITILVFSLGLFIAPDWSMYQKWVGSLLFFILMLDTILILTFIRRLNILRDANAYLAELYNGIQGKKSGAMVLCLEGENIQEQMEHLKKEFHVTDSREIKKF